MVFAIQITNKKEVEEVIDAQLPQARKEIKELEPLISEFLQVNYAKAAEIAEREEKKAKEEQREAWRKYRDVWQLETLP